MLTFEPKEHIYKWNGVVVPSVTQIIAPLTDYSMIRPEVLEKARQEGVHIHKMVEFDCLGKLDVASLPAWMEPYFKAWRKFVDESGFVLWESERQVYHRTYRYAGTLDLAGQLTKLTAAVGALLDVKRSLYAGPAIGVQTAAYEGARNSEAPKERRTRLRFGLQLRPDATYRLEEYKEPEDMNVFLSCHALFNWRQKHGIRAA